MSHSQAMDVLLQELGVDVIEHRDSAPRRLVAARGERQVEISERDSGASVWLVRVGRSFWSGSAPTFHGAIARSCAALRHPCRNH